MALEGLKNIIYFYGIGLAALSTAIALLWGSSKVSRFFFKQLFLCFAAIFVAVFLYETWGFFFKPNNSRNVKYTGTFFDNKAVSGPKKDLGFGPRADTSLSVTAQRYNSDTLIYDAAYTIVNGERLVPYNNPLAHKHAYFLGCSFVFGDGLNDSLTLPAYFSKLSGSQYKVRNLAFSGYGPHQALKIAEQQFRQNGASGNDSSVAVYYFLYEHLLRAAGKMPWSIYDPHYEVENDTLVYKGPFHNEDDFVTSYAGKRMSSVWQHSMLYRGFFEPKVSETDLKRAEALIERMHQIFKRQKIKFVVIMPKREVGQELYNELCVYLKQKRLNVVYVDSCENIRNISPEQLFIKGDGHPSGIFNRELAAGLLKRILSRSNYKIKSSQSHK